MQTARNIHSPISLNQTLSPYGYLDYRTYLRDFYDFKKSGIRGYSYRSFSKSGGFTSPNFLKLVTEGDRNIGAEALPRFIKALGLKGPMADYFRCLVALNQAKSDADRDLFFKELKRYTPYAKRQELDSEGLKYVSHWLYPVIREMVESPAFNDDPHWIVRRLHGEATVTEVAAAIQFLLKEGFIERSASGKYSVRDHVVLSRDEVKSLAIRNYHRTMVKQAETALERIDIKDREFGAVTITLPESALEELKFKIKAFIRDTHDWAAQKTSESAGDIIAQLNVQMYPHTRNLNRKGEE